MPLLYFVQCVNLLVLSVQCTAQQQVLLWSLSVLDCLEVVVEMYSKVAFNEPGKWGMVILVQMLK